MQEEAGIGRRGRPTRLMNRMKSISLEQLDDEDGHWCFEDSQNNQQAIQRVTAANDRWRQASKHFLRGTYYRGPGQANKSEEVANVASSNLNIPNKTNTTGPDENLQQYGAGGQIASSYYPHPQQQEPRNCGIQPSSGSNIDRSCMIFCHIRIALRVLN